MGGSKRLLEEQTPPACGACGADMEWDNGVLACVADCPSAQMEHIDKLASHVEIRRRGWEAFHDGEAYEDAPQGLAQEAWQRGWKVAERGGGKP